MGDETWKNVRFHESYMVSSHGRVKFKGTTKTVTQPNRKSYVRTFPENIVKGSLTMGYPMITLGYRGEKHYVHRLVAEHFIENGGGLEFVNHKDGDKTNNHVSNSEWVTQADNNRHNRRVLGCRAGAFKLGGGRHPAGTYEEMR